MAIPRIPYGARRKNHRTNCQTWRLYRQNIFERGVQHLGMQESVHTSCESWFQEQAGGTIPGFSLLQPGKPLELVDPFEPQL